QSLRAPSFGAWMLTLFAVACTAGAGQGPNETAEGDGDGVSPDEEFLSNCAGEECPSGTREGVREICESSKVGPRLLRRLTRTELQNTLRDVFPEVSAEFEGVE